MNEIKLNLPASLELDKDDLVNDNEPTYIKRNSWINKNKLSGLYKSTFEGYPTTKSNIHFRTGYVIGNKTYSVGDYEKVIESITTVDDLDIQYECKGRSLYGAVYQNNRNIVLSNYSSKIKVNGTSVAIYKDYAAVQYNNTLSVYQLSNLSLIKTLSNSNDVNSFVYINSTFYAYGYDGNDATKCWSVIQAGTKSFTEKFQGCLDYLDGKIVLTGQPVYKMDAVKNVPGNLTLSTYKTYLNTKGTMLCPYTIMGNNTIKWNLLASYSSPNQTPTETKISTYEDLEGLTTVVDNRVAGISSSITPDSYCPRYLTCFISGITTYSSDGTVDWPDIQYSFVHSVSDTNYYIYYCVFDKEWVSNNSYLPLIDPNTSPGVFWTTNVGEYESGFWFRDIFTNIQTDRGSIYDWGKGWSRHYSQRVCWQSVGVSTKQITYTDSTTPQYRFTGLCYLPLWFITNDEGVWFDTASEDYISTSSVMSLNGVSGANTYYSNLRYNASDYFVSYNIFDGDGNLGVLSPAVTWDNYYGPLGHVRVREIGYTEYSTHEYADFIHLIGDSNSGDKGQISTFPLVFNDDYFTRNIYNGVFTSIVKNGVLLNTSTDDGITYYDCEEYRVLIDDKIITFTEESNVTFKKLSEYTTVSNILNNDIILENRTNDKVVISQAYLSNMGMSLDNTFATAGFWSPTSVSNNNVLYAQGINENMNDSDYRSSSYLLPEITVPCYTHASQLNKLKQYQKEHNVFISPLVETNNQIDVYFNYTLLSTDDVYQYSIKDGVVFVDSKLKDNTWYITAETFYYPIGIIEALNVKNSNSTPFIELGNYSVELYEKDGYKTLMVNPTLSELSIEAVFSIYSSTYFFDGQSIYYRNGDENTFVTDALGLTFLANSGTEAYFYSDTDKNIYLFTGSTTLNPLKKVNKEIKSAVFSSSEQALYILFEDGLYRKHGDEETFIELTGESLSKTEDGAVVVLTDSFVKYKPFETANSKQIELELSTPWIGDYTRLYKFMYLDIITDGVGKLTATMDILYDDKSFNSFSLKNIKSDNGYRFRITPKDVKGNAFRFSVKSNIGIKSLILGSEPISNDVISTRI